MKSALKTQLSQNLQLTPQLLASIRLLQLTGLELEQELAEVLENNPLLERVDEKPEVDTVVEPVRAQQELAAFDELNDSYNFDGRTASGFDPSALDDRMAALPAQGSSDPMIRILEQLRFDLDEEQLPVAAFWLQQIDERGFLEDDATLLAQRVAAQLGVSRQFAEKVRQKLLRSEHTGVCAEDLSECLLAQLEDLPQNTAGLQLARKICLGDLSVMLDADNEELAEQFNTGCQDAAKARALLRSLKCEPLSPAENQVEAYVVPDVIVRWQNGTWQVSLNPATAPKLRIVESYERAVMSADDADSVRQMKDMLNEARWFSRGVATRADTLFKAAQVIVTRQQEFFAHGDIAIVPMTLKEVGAIIGVHESTVSRITHGKYMQTPRGTIEMKHFFAVRLEGAAVAGVAVKAMVKKLIEAESDRNPLADETIAGLLARQGVNIARRTVAKYREQLKIPSARSRGRARRSGSLRNAG